MLADLLTTARERADRSVPAVRCAALFHIARVLKNRITPLAERVLDEALAGTASLPDDERAILSLKGSYAIEVRAGSATSRAFLNVIFSELGLSLSMARRMLPTLIVA